MLKDKIYITDRQAFIEWKRKHTNRDDMFDDDCLDEEEPKLYPCILLEIEEYNNQWDDYNIYYYYIYLTDFISSYGK